MNSTTVSAECFDGCCSACQYEDCACICHIENMSDDDVLDLASAFDESLEAGRR
jgi:hypothetical protein